MEEIICLLTVTEADSTRCSIAIPELMGLICSKRVGAGTFHFDGWNSRDRRKVRDSFRASSSDCEPLTRSCILVTAEREGSVNCEKLCEISYWDEGKDIN